MDGWRDGTADWLDGYTGTVAATQSIQPYHHFRLRKREPFTNLTYPQFKKYTFNRLD
jgi:hypothetical protein